MGEKRSSWMLLASVSVEIVTLDAVLPAFLYPIQIFRIQAPIEYSDTNGYVNG